MYIDFDSTKTYNGSIGANKATVVQYRLHTATYVKCGAKSQSVVPNSGKILVWNCSTGRWSLRLEGASQKNKQEKVSNGIIIRYSTWIFLVLVWYIVKINLLFILVE